MGVAAAVVAVQSGKDFQSSVAVAAAAAVAVARRVSGDCPFDAYRH